MRWAFTRIRVLEELLRQRMLTSSDTIARLSRGRYLPLKLYTKLKLRPAARNFTPSQHNMNTESSGESSTCERYSDSEMTACGLAAQVKQFDQNSHVEIQEGRARILFPSSNEVFYNPVQEFNRDLRYLGRLLLLIGLRHNISINENLLIYDMIFGYIQHCSYQILLKALVESWNSQKENYY